MNIRLYCIFFLFILNIIIHTFVEKSNTKVPDFRYTKTICTPGYKNWLHQSEKKDIMVVHYFESRTCWI
jgi:hypothetical protein